MDLKRKGRLKSTDSKNNSIQRMIMKEIWRIKLIRPLLMDAAADEIILIAVNSLRMELEAEQCSNARIVEQKQEKTVGSLISKDN